MQLKDLSGDHLCRKVKITAADSSVEGLLVGIEHSCELIDDSTWGDAAQGVTRYTPGRRYADVTIEGWGKRRFLGDAECEVEMR